VATLQTEPHRLPELNGGAPASSQSGVPSGPQTVAGGGTAPEELDARSLLAPCTVTVECDELQLGPVCETLTRSFRHLAKARTLLFTTDFDLCLAPTVRSDFKRLRQILKNLLSHALKFTEAVAVPLHIGVATGGCIPEYPMLSRADAVIRFSVNDTRIGIRVEKQKAAMRRSRAVKCCWSTTSATASRSTACWSGTPWR